MKPAPFDYVAPAGVDEAVGALGSAIAEGLEPKLLAGGQSLVPMMALRLARPSVIVDLNRAAGLAEWATTGAGVRVGAMVRHRDLELQTDHPLLAEAARWIGHQAIRTRGTFGGSLAHADPAAELPLVVSSLGATIEAHGPKGPRSIEVEDLFEGYFSTALADNEVLTAALVPVPARWGFAELARRHGDFGLVTVVVAEVDGVWRIRVGGVGPMPWSCGEAETLLADGVRDAERIGKVAAAALESHVEAEGRDGAGDVHASGAYRRAMTGGLVARAVRDALDRRDR